MSEELNRRITNLEVSHRDIARELRESNLAMNVAINKLTNDVNVLVTTVGHLSKSIDDMAKVMTKTHQIEIDLVTVKSSTESLKKLWHKVNEIESKVAAQSPVSNAVKLAGITALSSLVGMAIAFIFKTGGGS